MAILPVPISPKVAGRPQTLAKAIIPRKVTAQILDLADRLAQAGVVGRDYAQAGTPQHFSASELRLRELDAGRKGLAFGEYHDQAGPIALVGPHRRERAEQA